MKIKVILGTVAAALVINAALGQGTLNFNTRVPPDIDVKIFQWDGVTPLAGDGYTAQLYGGIIGGSGNSLMPLFPVTGFLTGADAGYVVPVGEVAIPGIPEGDSASLLLRVWDNQGQQISTFEQALLAGVFHGQSAIFDVAWLGGSVLPPANLTGLQSFALIPEPRAGWLIGLGLVLVGLRGARRSRSLEKQAS
jgi:hypothetical protein